MWRLRDSTASKPLLPAPPIAAQAARTEEEAVTPLAIVHTESSLGWGGQEIRILSESQGLIRRGHDVKLICSPEARIFVEAKNWGVPAIALPIAKKRPLGVKVLAEWLKRNRCDVLSAHSSTDSWLAALALLVLGRPVRLVRTRHISARCRATCSRAGSTRARLRASSPRASR